MSERILVMWGRFYDGDIRTTVPEKNLWVQLQAFSRQIATSFTVGLAPPMGKAWGGAINTSDGYGAFDIRDLGTKDQQGGVPTWYGTLEDAMRLVGGLNASGAKFGVDLTLHQLSGENGGAGVFNYKGSHMGYAGRGSTTPDWFWTRDTTQIPPFNPMDTVPGGPLDPDFGRPFSYQHSEKALANAKDYISWITRRVGAPMARADDAKGINRNALADILHSAPTGIVFGAEFFDGNKDNEIAFAAGSPMNGRTKVFDFTTKYRVQDACNNYDARMFTAGGRGVQGDRPDLAIIFAENPDTDTSRSADGGINQQIAFNKRIAYTYLFGLPCYAVAVYGKDYFPSAFWPGAYGLKATIDNLCWINGMFAIGAFMERWVDKDVYCYTRDGNGGQYGWSGGLLVAVNFNVDVDRTLNIYVGDMWGAGTHLQDYQGHIGDVWVGPTGWLKVTIPRNTNSAGYSTTCLSKAGVNQPLPVTPIKTVQTFFGSVDHDLDVEPLINGSQVMPQRIYVRPGTSVSTKLSITGPGTGEVTVIPDPKSNWRTIQVVGKNLPAAGASFELTVTYTGYAS